MQVEIILNLKLPILYLLVEKHIQTDRKPKRN